jgi:hypothetical protein
LAAPVAAGTPIPAPKPAPTNPFTLDPITPGPTTLPIIGTTHAKPLCTALRKAIAPAVQAAMKNDATYKALRSKIFDYVVKDPDEARDLHLMQMDRAVDGLVKSTDELEDALKNPALEISATTSPADAKTIRELKGSMSAVLAAQKVQLNAMSGFVETERMRRFGQASETEQQMQNAVNPNVLVNGAMATSAPMTGFLRDSSQIGVLPEHQTVKSLHDAHMLDADLGDIAAVTQHNEEIATKVIVPATDRCK